MLQLLQLLLLPLSLLLPLPFLSPTPTPTPTPTPSLQLAVSGYREISVSLFNAAKVALAATSFRSLLE